MQDETKYSRSMIGDMEEVVYEMGLFVEGYTSA